MFDKLFEYESYENELNYVQFNDCTLKVQIGDYQVGSKIDNIAIMYFEGKMNFYVGEDSVNGVITKQFDIELLIK